MSPEPRSCPVCQAVQLQPFYAQSSVPTHVGILWPTRSEAIDCPRGDLDLGYCAACGFVFNMAFDPALTAYGHTYDNALHFSSVFQAYERDLAARLVERYDLHDADIVELGSGSGHFLGVICALGANRGLGFDPSFDAAQAGPLPANVSVRTEFFSREHADTAADLVVCRHVLEHVPDPGAFLREVRAGIGERSATVLYLEVPNGLLALRRLSVGDLIYEHVSYFLESSLRSVVELAGFEVIEIREVYDGQFLAVEAHPAPATATPPAARPVEPETLDDIRAFDRQAHEKVDGWRRLLADLEEDGSRTVAWGAGAKAVGFFNVLNGSAHGVDRLVDLNPRKQGTFLAGTGQSVVAPDQLLANPPNTVLVMNALYAKEIGEHLATLGIEAEIVTI